VKALSTSGVGWIFWWRIHVESYRRSIASVCKFVLCARGDTHKVSDLHHRTFPVDLRGKLALNHQEHLIAILVSFRILAGRLSRAEFHHRNLTTLGSSEDFEPLGLPKDVRMSHRFRISRLAPVKSFADFMNSPFYAPPRRLSSTWSSTLASLAADLGAVWAWQSHERAIPGALV
jgi:hypothetical protein